MGGKSAGLCTATHPHCRTPACLQPDNHGKMLKSGRHSAHSVLPKGRGGAGAQLHSSYIGGRLPQVQKALHSP